MNGDFAETVSCRICGSNDFIDFPDGGKHLNLVPPLKVVRCASCHLLFLNPRPSAQARAHIFAGRKPAGLEDYLDNLANYGAVTKSRMSMFRARVRHLQSEYMPGTRIRALDIGASSGEFLEAARDAGWEAFGIEPSLQGVRKAAEKHLNVIQSSAESLPFPDESFDLVHSNHVFEHLSDPLTAAREAFRVLKPGGVIFIEVPNQFDNIQFFRYRLVRRIPVRKRNIRSIHHLVFFSQRSLRQLLIEPGFEEIRIVDRYGSMRAGMGRLGSILVRMVGKLYLGAPIIQAIARKR